MSNGRFRLELLGPFGLFRPDGKRIEITSRKAMAMVALLAMAPGGRRTREYLRNMLWETRGAKQAQDSLRRELSNLRIVLELNEASGLLDTEIQRVGLVMDMVDVDVSHLGVGTLWTGHGPAGEFLEGIDLPAAERFEEWLRHERSRTEELLRAENDNTLAPPPTPSEIYGGAVPDARETLGKSSLSLPPKPSIAVLPFVASGNLSDAWLGEAIAENVERLISRFPQLFLASGNSSRLLAGRGLTAQQIAGRLGVGFVIEGRVREMAGRLRVTVSLVDGRNGEQLWADSIDGASDDLWLLQDEIAARIAPRIWSMIDLAERDRSLRELSRPSGSYERYWRASALLRRWEGPALLEACELADTLVQDNPTCPWATSLAAYCYSLDYFMGYSADRAHAYRRGSMLCQEAMWLAGDNVEALGYCAGTIMNLGGNLDSADRLITRALHVFPLFQPTLFWGGWVDIFRGQTERARGRFELALRINPASGARAQTLCGIGFAALLEGDLPAARDLFADAELEDPAFPMTTLGKLAADPGQADGGKMAAFGESGRQMAMSVLALFQRAEHRAQLAAALGAAIAAASGSRAANG